MRGTGLAVLAVAPFGLDGDAGLAWRGTPNPVTLPSVLASDPALAARVQALLGGAYADARELVHARRAAVGALARVLTEQHVLTAARRPRSWRAIQPTANFRFAGSPPMHRSGREG